MMLADFRRPRARPGFRQKSSLPKKSRSFLRPDPDVGLNALTEREQGRALSRNFWPIEAQVGVHRREGEWLKISKRRHRHDAPDRRRQGDIRATHPSAEMTAR